MELFVIWVILAIIIGAVGSSRKIGFGGAFLLSLILSPLLGLIITLTYKSLDDVKRDNKIIESLKRQSSSANDSITDELRKLKNMYDNDELSEDDYNKAKAKILS